MNGQKTISSLPRRYEDTKPALNQVFTHGSILDIGHKISIKSKEKSDHEKQSALKQLEQELWKKAEDYKDDCVVDALNEAKRREEKNLKHIRHEHEVEMKKEINRTEEVLLQRSVERCFEERVNGEKKLNEIVKKLYENFADEKNVVIEVTRCEEQNICKQKLQDAEKEFQIKLQEQRNEGATETENKLEELRINMKEEARVAVEKAVNEERENGNAKIAEISSEYEEKIRILNQDVYNKNVRIKNLEQELREMTELKDCYITKLQETRDAFVNFAEKCRPDFDVGQSDFIIPVNVINPKDQK